MPVELQPNKTEQLFFLHLKPEELLTHLIHLADDVGGHQGLKGFSVHAVWTAF